jgi:5-methylcytosine-specific restriction enzyme A
MSRTEFSMAVRRAALERCNWHCEGTLSAGHPCKVPLQRGRFHFDHDLPDWMGGTPTLDNCVVLCIPCHTEKTGKRDIPTIAKTKRIIDRENGIRKPRTMTRWRRFSGEVVIAPRQR